MATFDVVQTGFSGYFRMIQANIHELTDPLSTEQFWERPYPYGNSIGNLVLHLTGNLNYYIGAQIAGTGYVRHRDQEFSECGKPKDALLRDFDKALEIVLATIANQSAEDWAAAYVAEREPEAKDRFTLFLRCAGHAYHHVGQIVYLQRELLKRSS